MCVGSSMLLVILIYELGAVFEYIPTTVATGVYTSSRLIGRKSVLSEDAAEPGRTRESHC